MSIDSTMQLLMRRAIKAHPKAKQWAKVNCENNFALAVYNTAEAAVISEAFRRLDTPEMVEWFNTMVDSNQATKLRKFVLTACREMYRMLRV